jgi:hypothetical protein
MVYLISYDLRQPGRDYSQLIDAIQKLGPWARVLESLWTVDVNAKADAIAQHLRAYIDPSDGLFVVGLTTDWQSYGVDQKVNAWLRQALP